MRIHQVVDELLVLTILVNGAASRRNVITLRAANDLLIVSPSRCAQLFAFFFPQVARRVAHQKGIILCAFIYS